MQTSFTLEQLADPNIAEADRILRTCVHCGFCTATCPTYVLLGDELDSPRGRIYLIKDMLENDRPATTEVVKHIDRCLSCLACMTTCPSGVHYMHLVDHARAHIERTYTRPPSIVCCARSLPASCPIIALSMELGAARLGKPFARLSARLGLAPIAAMLRLAPARLPATACSAGSIPAGGSRKAGSRCWTAALLPCSLPRSTKRRSGYSPGMGSRWWSRTMAAAARWFTIWAARKKPCGRPPADRCLDSRNGRGGARCHPGHGVGLRHDGQGLWLSCCGTIGLCREGRARVAAHLGYQRILGGAPACAAGATQRPRRCVSLGLLAAAWSENWARTKRIAFQVGFVVKDVSEGHLCCGSAGTYNILQPELAGRLRERKVANIEKLKPDVIAAGNIGCMTQIAAGTAIPVVHTVELIDWATGGPATDARREGLPLPRREGARWRCQRRVAGNRNLRRKVGRR